MRFVSNAPGHSWREWRVWRIEIKWSGACDAHGAHGASVRITTDQKVGGSNPLRARLVAKRLPLSQALSRLTLSTSNNSNARTESV